MLDPPFFRKSSFCVFFYNLGQNILDFTAFTRKKYTPQVFENQFSTYGQVYPCGLPLCIGLRTSDLRILRIRYLRHILFGSEYSLGPAPCEIYAFLMILGVFHIGTGSFQSAVHVKYVEIVAKVYKYYDPDCSYRLFD